MRTFAQICKDDKKMAQAFFKTPIIRTNKVNNNYTDIMTKKTSVKLGGDKPKVGKMLGAI